MSEEDFLTRWSRRKREVAAAERAAPPSSDVKPIETSADAPAEVDAEVRAKIEATLPPLESITQLSDVTAFLKAGVPADLHIWSEGGHGFGIRNRPIPISGWPKLVQEWMANRGFLPKAQ